METDKSLRGSLSLPSNLKSIGVAAFLSSLLIAFAAAPAFAQTDYWGVGVTYAPTLQPGENQLFTAITTLNGSLYTVSNVNATIITPNGGQVVLNGFIFVTNGIFQTVYNIPAQLGTFEFSITAWNGTSSVTTWGAFSSVATETSTLNSIASSESSNAGALAALQANMTAGSKATQSSLNALSSQVTAGTGAVENSLSSLDSALSGQISAGNSNVENSVANAQSSLSSLSSQVASGNSGIQSSLSGLSTQLNGISSSVSTASGHASNAETYSLGALVVALIAVLVAAYGAMRKR